MKSKGPYALHVSIVANYIVLDVRDPNTYEPIAAHYLSLTPFRRLIRDYFRIRDSYYDLSRPPDRMSPPGKARIAKRGAERGVAGEVSPAPPPESEYPE